MEGSFKASGSLRVEETSMLSRIILRNSEMLVKSPSIKLLMISSSLSASLFSSLSPSILNRDAYRDRKLIKDPRLVMV